MTSARCQYRNFQCLFSHRNINLNNYPYTKISSQDLRIPCEKLRDLGGKKNEKRHTEEARKDSFALPQHPSRKSRHPRARRHLPPRGSEVGALLHPASPHQACTRARPVPHRPSLQASSCNPGTSCCIP